MAGTFGYELDLGNVTEEEKEEIRQQIKEYKQLAPLIQTGLYYRLSNPVTDEVAAWEFVSEDGTQAMMQAVNDTDSWKYDRKCSEMEGT